MAAVLAGALLLAILQARGAELGSLYPGSQVAVPADVSNAAAVVRSALLSSNASTRAVAYAALTNWQAAVDAEALARAAGDTVALTNWQAVVYSLTNGAALGATALQPSWAATGTVQQAGYAAEAYWASVADDAGTATQLAPGVPDKLALDAATTHLDDPAAHPDIRGAIDAIPLPPTNAVAGWLVWDTGSNCYWRVSATNLRFYVWGVDP